MENYLYYITKKKLIKKYPILVSIPTCNNCGITRKTLKKIYKQQGIDFDILIIDNNSEDYLKLVQDFPNLNYVLLKENTGNSGAQRIAMELALKHEYKYIVCTDNDAFLTQNDGLKKLYDKLINNASIDCASANHCDNLINEDIFCKKQLPFHYLFIKCSFLKKIELHNFYIFLVAEDVAFTSKIVSEGKLLLCHNITYYHDAFKPKFIQNSTIYFGIRGFLIILFYEKNIKFSLKFYHFLHLFYYPALAFCHSLILKDASYLQTVFLAIWNFFINYKKIYAEKIQKNKYALVESKKSLPNAIPMTTFNSLFIRKEYYWYSNYFKKKQFYKLQKNI